MDEKTLTQENAAEGRLIKSKSHPETGTWVMHFEGGYWEIRGRRGTKVLDEGEFHFWQIIK